jgi:hypothetical protein
MVFYECFMDDAETKHVPMEIVSFEVDGVELDRKLVDDYNKRVEKEEQI